VEVFNAKSRGFTRLGKLESGRYQHKALAMEDGSLLLVGGKDDKGAWHSTLEIVDPESGNGRSIPIPESKGAPFTAVRLRGGATYILCREGSSPVYRLR
jgi:hypothetical protein